MLSEYVGIYGSHPNKRCIRVTTERVLHMGGVLEEKVNFLMMYHWVVLWRDLTPLLMV